MGEYPFFWADFLKEEMVKFCCFPTAQVRCWDGLATAEIEAGILPVILASFFQLLFRTIMASSLTSGCADAFSTHTWNGWRKRSYLLKDFSQPVAIWRRCVTGRDRWEMGTVVYFWLHDPCLCLPPLVHCMDSILRGKRPTRARPRLHTRRDKW